MVHGGGLLRVVESWSTALQEHVRAHVHTTSRMQRFADLPDQTAPRPTARLAVRSGARRVGERNRGRVVVRVDGRRGVGERVGRARASGPRRGREPAEGVWACDLGPPCEPGARDGSPACTVGIYLWASV